MVTLVTNEQEKLFSTLNVFAKLSRGAALILKKNVHLKALSINLQYNVSYWSFIFAPGKMISARNLLVALCRKNPMKRV